MARSERAPAKVPWKSCGGGGGLSAPVQVYVPFAALGQAGMRSEKRLGWGLATLTVRLLSEFGRTMPPVHLSRL